MGSSSPSRRALVDRYQQIRARSRSLFDLIEDEAYFDRPIAVRHPIVFYEGHLPAFSFNTLVRKALSGSSIDPELERFFARGIDPPEGPSATSDSHDAARWPSREAVRAFAAEADERVIDALLHAEIDRPGDPLLDRSEAVFAILEHEAMHQETLLYMWHRLPFDQKRKPADYQWATAGTEPAAEWVEIPGGSVKLGVDRTAIPFGWDNEFPACVRQVPTFAIERHDVTNARFLEFVEAGGYRDPRWWTAEDWAWIQTERIAHPSFWEREGRDWWWRGMFERIPLPASWPVYVSHAEASAFARWRGSRLPTEAEFQCAAYGSADDDRPWPWGCTDPSASSGVFDFARWDPAPVGTHASGASPHGVHDLVGNGWEWTSTPFEPFPGFRQMASYPEYSADFFDGQHFVMKGASPATSRELLRPTFRNWFRPRYPYVYATFRCVKAS